MKILNKFILFFLILGITNINAQTNQVSIISEVAKAELLDYLNKIPEGQEAMFGFNDRVEFLAAEIGHPYEMITLKKDFLKDKNLISDKNYLISTNNWRVPIVVTNEARALLTVSKIDNQWKVVKIGAKGLANELQVFNRNNTFIGELKMFRVFQLQSDFLLTEGNIVYPLTSARKLFEIKSKENISYSLDDILSLLKNKITVK